MNKKLKKYIYLYKMADGDHWKCHYAMKIRKIILLQNISIEELKNNL